MRTVGTSQGFEQFFWSALNFEVYKYKSLPHVSVLKYV